MGSDERADQHEDELSTEDDPTNDDDAKGALQKDNPVSADEGSDSEGGLGTQTGASGGGEATEPEDATPERAQSAGD